MGFPVSMLELECVLPIRGSVASWPVLEDAIAQHTASLGNLRRPLFELMSDGGPTPVVHILFSSAGNVPTLHWGMRKPISVCVTGQACRLLSSGMILPLS